MRKRHKVKNLVDTGLKEIKEAGEDPKINIAAPKDEPITVHSLLKPRKGEKEGEDDDERAAKSNRFYDHEKAF